MSDTAQRSEAPTDGEPRRPPERVVELRVHGVSGTPPEAMLDEPFPRQVAGDDVGRFFRRSAPVRVDGFPDRDVEAYHWGRFTAGSPSRALWLLLLPFAVVNLARFALLLPAREVDADRAVDERRWKHRTADALLRLIGLVLTLAMVVTVCYLAWEVVARQCSGDRCAGQPNGMAWFGGRSPGTRVLVAAVLPAAVLALVWSFGRSPALVEPPGPRTRVWAGNGRVGDPAFWHGAASAPAQRAAHVWASCAVIGVLALATVGNPDDVLARTPPWADRLYLLLAALCGVGLGVALEVVVQDRKPATVEPDPHGKDTVRIHPLHSFGRWAMAVVAAGCVLFAWRAIDTTVPRQPGRNELFAGAAGLVGTAAGCLLVVLFLLTLDMAVRVKDSRRLCRGGGTQDDPAVPPAFRPYWRGMGGWMLAALAVTLGFGFSTATVFWAAGLLGNPVAPAAILEAPGRAGTGAPIEIAAGYWTAASVWGGLVVVAVASALPTAAWLLRRRPLLVTALVAAAGGLLVVAVVRANDGEDLVSSSAEWFVAGGVLLAVATLLVVVPDKGGGLLGLVGSDYEPERPEAAAEARVLRQWRVAMARYRYHHAIGLIAGLGGLATILWAALSLWELLFADADPLPSSWNGPLNVLTSIGVAAASAVAGSLLVLGVATWRNPRMRTTVGILWDMVSFWPRVAHPLCPLPYGGRAVRAVAKRASELANEDLSEDDQGRRAPYESIVLSGHSQGSVIVEAACAVLKEEASRQPSGRWIPSRRAEETIGKISLVTYGSQIQFIYARLFPSYFGYALQREMFGGTLGTRWRNLYRWTDPLGGPVLSWPHVAGRASAHDRYGPAVLRWNTMACTEQCEGHPAVRVDGPEVDGVCYRRWTIGPDVRLRDPGLVTDSAFAARLPARGHSGYPSDRGFDVIVATLAGQVEPYVPECARPQPPPPDES